MPANSLNDFLATVDTKRDIAAMDHLLDTHWFSTQRIRFTEGEWQFVQLMLAAQDLLTKNNFKIDYVEISNARTLEPVRQWVGKLNLIALIAAFQDEIRLIDNMILNDELN